jgi:hypothetical protein
MGEIIDLGERRRRKQTQQLVGEADGRARLQWSQVIGVSSGTLAPGGTVRISLDEGPVVGEVVVGLPQVSGRAVILPEWRMI